MSVWVFPAENVSGEYGCDFKKHNMFACLSCLLNLKRPQAWFFLSVFFFALCHCALISTISWLKLFPTKDMKQIPTTEWMEHAVFSLSPTSVIMYKDVFKRCNKTYRFPISLRLIERRLSRASSRGICAKNWNQQRYLHSFQPHFRPCYFRFLNYSSPVFIDCKT